MSDLPEVDAVSFEKQVYDVLWDMRIAPRHQIEQAAKKIVGLAARDEWISVKDRLPEIELKVLTWDGNYVNITCRWPNDWLTESKARSKAITHWKPLPNPPKD